MTTNLTYTNPSAVRPIGDPFVLKADDNNAYYCYPTSGPGFKVWKTLDFLNWEPLGQIYDPSQDGFWATSRFWAPEIVFHEGVYYMYYTGNWFKTQTLRIGLATSDKPEGPFVEALKKPLFDFGYGALDAHVFFDDDGKKYLYYSRAASENMVGGVKESWIYGVRLSDNMREVSGEPVLLTKPDQEWEKRSGTEMRWNEGAHIIKRGNTYYLMYSANNYGKKFYGLGYAVSNSPLGPFVKYRDNPILESLPEWNHVSGPGHHSLFPSPDGNEIWAAYHTHMDILKGGGQRQLAIDRIGFREDGSLYINGPSLSPMPLPSGSGTAVNLSRKATITASSNQAGVKALVDNEIGFNKRFAGYDWIADPNDKSPEITFSWEKPVNLRSIMVFRGSPYMGTPFEAVISLDNQDEKTISFPEIPGSAAILTPDEAKAVSSCTIKLTGGGEKRLSEIVILGN